MPEASVTIDLNMKGEKLNASAKKAADTFVNNVQKGLENILKKMNVGGGDSVKQGAIAGAVGGGIVKLLDLILDAVMDIPVIGGIMKMLKLILMSLFFPLIPILKPILIALGQMAKTMVGGLIPKTQTEEIAASSGAIAGAAIGFGIGGPWGALIGGVLGGIVGQLLAKLIEWLAKIDWVGLGKDISVFMLKILTGAFNGILELFGMKEEDIGNTLTVLRDIFEYTVSWLSNNWNSIKSTLDFVTTWLDESWTNIKTALSDAEVMIINIVEAFKKIYNKIAETWGGHILGLEPIPTSSGGSSGGNVNHTGNANVVHNNTGGYVPNQSNASGQSSYYNAYMSGAGILDGIVQNGRIITTHPDDFLIATKNPGSLGKGMTVNINIDRPSVTNQNDIKALVKEIEMELYKAQRRYNSYA